MQLYTHTCLKFGRPFDVTTTSVRASEQSYGKVKNDSISEKVKFHKKKIESETLNSKTFRSAPHIFSDSLDFPLTGKFCD